MVKNFEIKKALILYDFNHADTTKPSLLAYCGIDGGQAWRFVCFGF